MSDARHDDDRSDRTIATRAVSTLPIPSWHGWRLDAACKDLDTELFFPNGDGEGVQEQVAQARAVCASCPVRGECLEFALTTRQEDGVWGGLTEEERKRWRRRQQRERRQAS